MRHVSALAAMASSPCCSSGCGVIGSDPAGSDSYLPGVMASLVRPVRDRQRSGAQLDGLGRYVRFILSADGLKALWVIGV
jgi:hypothetical protein